MDTTAAGFDVRLIPFDRDQPSAPAGREDEFAAGPRPRRDPNSCVIRVLKRTSRFLFPFGFFDRAAGDLPGDGATDPPRCRRRPAPGTRTRFITSAHEGPHACVKRLDGSVTGR